MYCQKPSKYDEHSDMGGFDRPPMDVMPPVCTKPYKSEYPTKGFPNSMEKTLRK